MFYRHERTLLKSEREQISLFCSEIFGVISLIMVCVFGVLMFFAVPFFNTTYLLMYGVSFAVFLFLTLSFYRIRNKKKSCYLPFVYIFVIYLYMFGILVSISSTSGSHAATSIICLQIIFPLLIFDRSLHVNVLSVAVYVIHSLLAWKFKERPDFILDVFNGGAFTLVGIIIGEYERYVKLSNFEKDRILIYQKNTDMLTELPNRRVMFERFSDLEKNGFADGGIFMLDIDHFKKYNDSLGHQQGDLCLKLLGKTFAEFGEKHNMEFYRYGGEEFCAFSTETSFDGLKKLAEEIRLSVFSLALPFEMNDGGFVTVSIGFSPYKKGCTFENSIKKADEALYEAKRSGRNTSCGRIFETEYL